MERKKVISSNINSIGYDEKTHTLEVEFYNNKVYTYKPITINGYKELINAESIGSYFDKHIKGNKLIECNIVT